jgi:GT2 family glycosyltransferase
VSVIIPNWNGKDLLEPCLESLYRQQFDDFETILVDNGSNDGSVTFVQENFPQVAIIRFEENRGFSAAVNAGIAASRSPYICLLNNDTEVDPLWLKEIVAALDANSDVGSAASKILFFSDPKTVNSAGDEFSLFGVAYQRRLMRGDGDLFSVPQYVFSACGAAALYRRGILEKVGLFDEVFFAYQEDVDIGFRIQLAGYRCLFVPTAIVYHKYHATSSRNSNLWFYLRERNKYFILIKNLSGKLLFLCFPLVLLQEVFSLIEAVWRGQIGAYWRARRDLWSYLPHLLRERRIIQACRVVGDAYVLGLMRFREPLSIALYSLRALLTIKQQQTRGIS